jgi:intracellular sulfur oxidation DsrE/DsrF family protein
VGAGGKSRIESLLAIGVEIVACGATLDSMHKTAADLIENVGTVPNGLPELVERQLRGWTYVRP